MSNRLKLIIAGVIVVLAVIAMIIAAVINNRTAEETDTTTAEEAVVEEQATSMHEGGEELTKEDAAYVENIENYAKDQAVDYLKKQFPDHQTILVTIVEWYFTDENESENILVWAEVVDNNGKRSTEANVVEIETDGKNFTKKSIYKPDSRYDI